MPGFRRQYPFLATIVFQSEDTMAWPLGTILERGSASVILHLGSAKRTDLEGDAAGRHRTLWDSFSPSPHLHTAWRCCPLRDAHPSETTILLSLPTNWLNQPPFPSFLVSPRLLIQELEAQSGLGASDCQDQKQEGLLRGKKISALMQDTKGRLAGGGSWCLSPVLGFPCFLLLQFGITSHHLLHVCN